MNYHIISCLALTRNPLLSRVFVDASTFYQLGQPLPLQVTLQVSETIIFVTWSFGEYVEVGVTSHTGASELL